MTTNALLVATDVCFRYADADADTLRGVSFDLRAGELLGVLGPNGAGKSTLLRLLAALDRPSRGHVSLDGKDVSSWSRNEIAKRMAVVSQREQSAFGFRVRDVVLMGRAPHVGFFGLESRDDVTRASEALRRCDVWHLRDRAFDSLSGGEQKRVALARALAQETPILLLDEPAAFLDARHQVEMHDLVAELVESRSLAALAVMHDLNLAAQYCDRVMLMADGAVSAIGSVSDVMTYARIKETFGCDVYVGVNELTSTRYFVPMGRHRARRDRDPSTTAEVEPAGVEPATRVDPPKT